MKYVVALLVVSITTAIASTPVVVTTPAAGYTLGMKITVGRGGDVEAERAELKKRLASNAKRFAATYRQLATGRHPYTATRKLLDARTTRDGKYANVQWEGFSLDLHLAATASEAATHRAAADFALAQLSPGGDLVGNRGDVCAADADQHFTRSQLFTFSLDSGNGAYNVLLWARNCKAQIKRFVTKPPPDSAYQKAFEQEDVAKQAPRSRLVGVAQGRALLAFLEQKPYDAADLAALDGVDAHDAERIARNLVLLLPAARHSWIAKNLMPYLAKAHPKLATGTFGAWLAEMAKL